MIRAGVPATISFTFNAGNDPNHLLGRQGGYASKISLQDHRLPSADPLNGPSSTDDGASIECYPNQSGASQRYAYLHALTGSVLGDGYDYLAGSCVLRLDKALTPSEAAQYQAAFTAGVG